MGISRDQVKAHPFDMTAAQLLSESASFQVSCSSKAYLLSQLLHPLPSYLPCHKYELLDGLRECSRGHILPLSQRYFKHKSVAGSSILSTVLPSSHPYCTNSKAPKGAKSPLSLLSLKTPKHSGEKEQKQNSILQPERPFPLVRFRRLRGIIKIQKLAW